MNRLQTCLSTVAPMVVAVCCLNAAALAERPNILLLLSDDHSYPFVSCYGNENVKTPTLDALAAAGMKFHRFFTAAPQCVPSRAALMTGRSPVAARMTRFSSPLPRDEVTFPELLRAQGGDYTGVCGRSYHLDGSNRTGPATARVFQEHNLKTFVDRVDYLRTGPDAQVAGQVAELLDGKPADKPFFLWANFSDPHHVWNEIQEAHAAGRLPAGVSATYFTTPRPVYELYDLEADPSELTNLSGQREHAAVEQELRETLAEKMILDFDYLPLPALPGADAARPARRANRGRTQP